MFWFILFKSIELTGFLHNNTYSIIIFILLAFQLYFWLYLRKAFVHNFYTPRNFNGFLGSAGAVWKLFKLLVLRAVILIKAKNSKKEFCFKKYFSQSLTKRHASLYFFYWRIMKGSFDNFRWIRIGYEIKNYTSSD